MGYDPGYLSPTQQITDLQKKLAAMQKIRADFFTRVDTLRTSIATGRQAIADAKTQNDTTALGFNREQVTAWLEQLDTLQTPPPDEGSVQYKAIQQRIADLETEVKATDARQPILSLDDPRITKARAARNKALGDTVEAQEEAQTRANAAADAARLKRIDGTI
jgi:phage shock protein A